MAYQLVYSSVPAGLVAGRSGFSTVARHREIRETLVSRIEAFSNVFDRGPLAGEETLGLPVIYAFHCIRLGAVEYHVLSRIRDSGSDYSGRVNHIAHSLVLEPGELETLRITPAEALLALEKAGKWFDKWAGGDPRYFEPKERVSIADLATSVSLPAEHWKKATGSAANAAQPWQAVPGDRCHLIFEAGTDVATVLQMVAESELLQDPQRRNPAALWSISFTSHLQVSDDRAAFQWSAVQKGSPAHSRLGSGKGVMVEVGPGLKAPASDLANVAEGKAVDRTDGGKVGVSSADAGPANVGIALPSAPAGGATSLPLPGRKPGKGSSYEEQIDSFIQASEKQSRRSIPWRWVAVVALALAIGALFLPGYLDRRRVGALAEELEGLLVRNEWTKARELLESPGNKKIKDNKELSEPTRVLEIGERLLQFNRIVHTLNDPNTRLNEITSGKLETDPASLVNLSNTAANQLSSWLTFQETIDSAWASLTTPMGKIAADPSKAAEILIDIGTPSIEKLRKLNAFSPSKDDSPYRAVEESINRLIAAREIVAEFGGLVQKLQAPNADKDTEAVKSKCVELADEVQKLHTQANPLEIASLNSISGPLGKMSYRPDDFRAPVKEAPTVVETPAMPDKPVATEEKPPPPEPKVVVLENLPPTFVVLWHEGQRYTLELDEGMVADGASQLQAPVASLLPKPGGATPWVPISSRKIRVELKGKPVFETESKGASIVMTRGPEVFDDTGSFLIRFAAANNAKPDAKPDYQVLVWHPAAADAAPQYLLELSAADHLQRSKEGGTVVVRLIPPLQDALQRIVSGDATTKGRRVVLRLSSDELGEFPPATLADKSSAASAPVSVTLIEGGGSGDAKAQLEKAWAEWTEMGTMREAFAAQFETAAVTLHKGVAWVETNYRKVPKKPDQPYPISKPVHPQTLMPETRSPGRPAFVEYIQATVTEVLGDKNVFDLGADNSDDRNVLKFFESVSAGWATGKFEGVREQLSKVTAYSKSRTPNIENNRDIFPSQKEGQPYAEYKEELSERERKANADRFFENWEELFSEKNLDAIWPYFVRSAPAGFDAEIGTTLEDLNRQKKAMEAHEARVARLSDEPLEKLGNWRLDWELPPLAGSSTPNSTIIPLIKFSSGSGRNSANGDSAATGAGPLIQSGIAAEATGGTDTGR